MGAWGAGVFENDLACDYLTSVVHQLVRNIEDCLDNRTNEEMYECGEEVLITSIDILNVLVVNYGSLVSSILKDLPLSDWKSRYLAAFDDQIVHYTLDVSSQLQRRRVIESTFSKLQDNTIK
jgi:hypothetical protein